MCGTGGADDDPGGAFVVHDKPKHNRSDDIVRFKKGYDRYIEPLKQL